MIDDDDRLVGLIYDGVADEASWHLALAQVADRVGAAGAGLGMQDMETYAFRNLGAFAIDPDLNPTYRRLASGNRIWQEIERRRQPLTDTMAMRKAEFKKTELFADWFRPQKFSSVMAYPMVFEERASAVVVAFRNRSQGDFGADDLVRLGRYAGHFGRALRLRLERERTAERLAAANLMLDDIRDAILLIDRNLRLRHANTSASAMLDAGMAIRLHDGRLEARDFRTHAKLERMAAEGRDGELRLPPSERGGPIIRLHPCANVLAFAATGAMIVRIIDPNADRERATAARLRDRLGLSPRQSEVIAALAAGATETEAARTLGLAEPTLHTHLRRAYDRLDLRSRPELLALLARHGFDTGRAPK